MLGGHEDKFHCKKVLTDSYRFIANNVNMI